MLPLKLVRSLVLGDPITNPLILPPNHHHQHNNINHSNHKPKKSTPTKSQTKTPLLLFIPTNELVTNTYRLATLARDIGMDLCPNPSLSHIILSWPSSSPSTLPWSTTSISSSWALPNGAVPLPFPSLTVSSVAHLRGFVALSKGFFKLVFLKSNINPDDGIGPITHRNSNWDCCSVSLILGLTARRIESMDDFCKALAGQGWTLFKTRYNSGTDSGDGAILSSNAVYLFRKVDSGRGRCEVGSSSGEYRIRELRLPPLDFRNAPLRILQYILLMTDDIFYLA